MPPSPRREVKIGFSVERSTEAITVELQLVFQKVGLCQLPFKRWSRRAAKTVRFSASARPPKVRRRFFTVAVKRRVDTGVKDGEIHCLAASPKFSGAVLHRPSGPPERFSTVFTARLDQRLNGNWQNPTFWTTSWSSTVMASVERSTE